MMSENIVKPPFILPDWPAPENIAALSTTREGGFSKGVYAGMNPALHVDDRTEDVLRNRRLLSDAVGMPVSWLNQVHGTTVVNAADSLRGLVPDADASFTNVTGAACAVLTADCLPVLFCDTHGACVAAAHAGWRGLAAGILQKTVAHMPCPPENIMAWMGPAIGPAVFEVGNDVREIFCRHTAEAEEAFQPVPGMPGKFFADIFALGRSALAEAGVSRVYGGGVCTFSDPLRFYSYRRDGQTGRMASMVGLRSR